MNDDEQQIYLDQLDTRLIAAIQSGLPLCHRPYEEIGRKIGLQEQEVIMRISRMIDSNIIKRMGVVVRHRKLGYRANAMVVWNIDDEHVSELGKCIGSFEFITLCYRRPRRLPDWKYNLFCMIHGHDHQQVMQHIEFLVNQCGLQGVEYEVLFSKRCFKQRGAHYRNLLQFAQTNIFEEKKLSHG